MGRFCNLDFGNFRPPGGTRQQNTNPMVFPGYPDPYGLSFFQMNSASIPPMNPASQKGFMVFDQSGNQTSLIFSSLASQFPTLNPANRGLDLPGSNQTYVCNSHGSEEMHEDTEEIDALLYSDSEDDEEASTGHSPLVTQEEEEEVASSSIVPTKRRRLEPELELDPLLSDTACSERARIESSFVGNGTHSCKRLKRERIRETVSILRRIIPGGKGKDAAAVLDEAIRYLRSLKLKAKGLAGGGATAAAATTTM